MNGDPIRPGSPLARVLEDYPVPPLSDGFADRVVAAAEARAPALPPLRRDLSGRGWRTGRRLAIAVMSFGALATAAAATGVLERAGLPVPSARVVWANITGETAPAVAAAPAKREIPAAKTASFETQVTIDGLIDTPEELAEAFRRIDEVRNRRRSERRETIDQRIDKVIERRHAAGLPVPDADQRARLRERIEQAQAEREALNDERIRLRREALQRRVENGEALTREDIAPSRRGNVLPSERHEQLERLRTMSPEARREALRQLPPAERREVMEAWRQRRAGRLEGRAVVAPPTAPSPSDTPDFNAPAADSPSRTEGPTSD